MGAVTAGDERTQDGLAHAPRAKAVPHLGSIVVAATKPA
jgi:hypothetical protein